MPLSTNPSRVGSDSVPVVVPVLRIARIQPDKPIADDRARGHDDPGRDRERLSDRPSAGPSTAAPTPGWHHPR